MALFKKKVKKDKIDVPKDVDAVLEFLAEVNRDVGMLQDQFLRLKELASELEVLNEHEVREANLEAQADVMDGLLEEYEFFQTDVDINSLRLKKIAIDMIRKAEKLDLNFLVKEKKKDWNLKW